MNLETRLESLLARDISLASPCTAFYNESASDERTPAPCRVPARETGSGLARKRFFLFELNGVICGVPTAVRLGPLVVHVHDEAKLVCDGRKVAVLVALDEPLECPEVVIDDLPVRLYWPQRGQGM